MTSLTPYKVADAVGPDGQRLGGAVGLATYRATHGKRLACLSKGSHVTFGKKKNDDVIQVNKHRQTLSTGAGRFFPFQIDKPFSRNFFFFLLTQLRGKK